MSTSSPRPLHTQATQAVFAELDAVRVRGGSLLLLGAPGTGKSRLLEHYASTRPSGQWAGPVMLHKNDVVNTPLGLVQALMAERGIAWRGDTRSGLRTLADTLEPGAMLLVDDAQKLASHTLDALRRLHDRCGLRLVLCGPPHLAAVVRHKCLELSHRLHGQITLPDVGADDVPAFLQAEGRRPEATLSRALYQGSGGNLYWLSEGLRLGRLDARARHERLTPSLIQAVFDARPGEKRIR